MTEVEKLKVQIVLLEDLLQVVSSEKDMGHYYVSDMADELEDNFGRRLAVLKSEYRQLIRQATAANPSGGSQQGTPQPSGAVPAL